MDFIFGAFSNEDKLSHKDYKLALEEFSEARQHSLEVYQTDRFLLATANSDRPIAFSADNHWVGAVSGHGHLDISKNFSIIHDAIDSDSLENISYCSGNFTAALFDQKSNSLVLCNDKYGTRPLFICEKNGCVYFCSEIEPLLKCPGVSKELDVGAIGCFFSLGTTIKGQTFFKNIYNLDPGSVYIYDGLKKQCYSYDKTFGKSETSHSIEDLADQFFYKVSEVTNGLVESLNIPAFGVTAGLDTRFLLGCLSDKNRRSLWLYTDKSSLIPDSENQDVVGAQALVEHYGLYLNLKEYTPHYKLSDDIWKRITWPAKFRTLGGIFGGEFLGGNAFNFFPISRSDNVWNLFEKNLKLFEGLPLLTGIFKSTADELTSAQGERDFFKFCVLHWFRSYHSTIYGGGDGQWQRPYAFSAYKITPFWDPSFLDLLFSTPFAFLDNFQLYYQIYKRHLADLMEIPTNSIIASLQDGFRKVKGENSKHRLREKLSYLEFCRTRWKNSLAEKSGILNLQYVDALLEGGSEKGFFIRLAHFIVWCDKYLD